MRAYLYKFFAAQIFFCAMLSTNSYAQESYLCVSEASGGVAYEKNINKWKGTVFRTKNEKILITSKNNKWVMRKFESTIEVDCNAPSNYGVMRCSDIFGTLIFNMVTRRYLSSYLAGYTDGSDNNDNTPNIEIGVCTKL
jgi:hypothetical protein